MEEDMIAESLSERQVERLKDRFRKELRAARSPEQAREEIRGLIEDLLDVDGEVASRLAEGIDQMVLDERAVIREKDAPAIEARGRSRWYTGPQPADVFWPSLERHLLEDKHWSEGSVQSIDEHSSSIVARLAPPESPETFSARGLVVGYVQSGKTANMTAVIAKALDSGYRLVIILAGLTDALRTQTQERMEEDLVAAHPELWDHLTTWEQDFDAGTRQNLVEPRKGGILAVVKKNTHVLARLRDFLEQTALSTRMKLPALVIDDETDQASPDVAKKTDEDPTTINKRIREILRRLPKCSYVGYTATPFANVLINPGAEGNEEYDRDLYPRDFIVSIPAPADYFGAERLFGRDLLSADDPGPSGDGVDVIRTIREEDIETIQGLEKGEAGPDQGLPPSLQEALLWFVLATAARTARGDEVHSTMLLHTSRLTEAHQNLELTVRSFLAQFRDTPAAARHKMLKDIWDREYPLQPATAFGREPLITDTVLEQTDKVLARTQVAQDNYVSETRLEFPRDGEPVWAVIIGGDRLARGVTLPGLVVSYFGRNARQYDTLMQMGRWFGYRHGYEELPRIWMTAATMSSFRELATIEAELREEISYYRDGSIRPIDWGVRIRKVPGMLVTRRPAMQHTKEAALSYSGEHLQTIRFYHRDTAWLQRNWQAGGRLLTRAVDDPSVQTEHRQNAFLVRNVPVDAILEFLRNYQTCREQVRTNTKALREYIEKYESAELRRWNVAVMMPASAKPGSLALGPVDPPRLVNRAALQKSLEHCTDIKALMSRMDILVDTAGPVPERRDWPALKDHRAKEYGGEAPPLLLLYPIDKDSEPRDTQSTTRQSLGAAHDVLGMGVVFPEDPRGFSGHYITVSLDEVVADEEDDPDGA